jgi:hypothetical protein
MSLPSEHVEVILSDLVKKVIRNPLQFSVVVVVLSLSQISQMQKAISRNEGAGNCIGLLRRLPLCSDLHDFCPEVYAAGPSDIRAITKL